MVDDLTVFKPAERKPRNRYVQFMRTVIIILTLTLTSCQDFVYKKKLIDNYYLVACDVGEQMVLTYNNDRGSNYSGLISATVFEANWNDRFIVVKTHPQDIKESIKSCIYYNYLNEQKLDKNGNNISKITIADSLAEIEVDKILRTNNLVNTKTRITLYYLLDTKNQGQNPIVFLTENELNKAIQDKQVGHLIHKEYFGDLDE